MGRPFWNAPSSLLITLLVLVVRPLGSPRLVARSYVAVLPRPDTIVSRHWCGLHCYRASRPYIRAAGEQVGWSVKAVSNPQRVSRASTGRSIPSDRSTVVAVSFRSLPPVPILTGHAKTTSICCVRMHA